ncbi:MAG TPA: hypothetical protein VM285_01945 [Polyangia bacterium]|nr:hypothetical protein [Polyangia bacterium]
MLRVGAALSVTLAFVAYGQTSGTVHTPSGVSYEFRYTVSDPRTEQVCLHEVDASGALVNVRGNAAVEVDDAITCTTTFIKDGTTVNQITHEFSPPLMASMMVALRAYDGAENPASLPSNWHLLVSPLRAPVLLD